MSTDIQSLIETARQGNWSPLLEEAKKAPGKHWAEDARCSNQDIDIFVIPGDDPFRDPDVVKDRLGTSLNRPRNLCAACPLAVAARCLVESLRDDDEYGIRAGLLASERSALRDAWYQRASESAVEAVLRGSFRPLRKAERHEVIARFATDPSLEPAAVASGLGVTHEYLLKLVRRYWNSRSKVATALPDGSADAA